MKVEEQLRTFVARMTSHQWWWGAEIWGRKNLILFLTNNQNQNSQLRGHPFGTSREEYELNHVPRRWDSFQVSHTFKRPKNFLSDIFEFLFKEEWPSSSPLLDLMDFCICYILEMNTSANAHFSGDDLKLSLLLEWNKIAMKTLCASVDAVSKRLLDVKKTGRLFWIKLYTVLCTHICNIYVKFQVNYFIYTWFMRFFFAAGLKLCVTFYNRECGLNKCETGLWTMRGSWLVQIPWNVYLS